MFSEQFKKAAKGVRFLTVEDYGNPRNSKPASRAMSAYQAAREQIKSAGREELKVVRILKDRNYQVGDLTEPATEDGIVIGLPDALPTIERQRVASSTQQFDFLDGVATAA